MPQVLRQLQRRPGLSLAILLTMACGIALNVAVFTVVKAVLLEPLPFPEGDRIVAVGSVRTEEPARLRTVSLNDLADWKTRGHSFDALAAWRDWGFRMRTPQGLVSAYAVIVTPELFTILPVKPVTGRLFGSQEDQPGRNLVVLISTRLWQDHFGSDPAIAGKTVMLTRAPAGERPYTIIGVVPADIGVPEFEDVDVWALSSADEDAGLRRELRNRRILGRLRPAVTLDEANAELQVLARGLAQAYPASNAGWSARAVPFTEWMLGPTRTILLAFFVAVASVVLIACANVAGILLASTAGRRREFAVRLALGATRRRIAVLVLGESVAMAVVAGAVAMLISGWLVRGLLALGPAIPRAEQSVIDWRVFLFAAGLSILCGVLFGIAPALRETQADVADALRADRSGAAGSKTARLRAVLVATQVAVALVLVAAAAAASRTVVDLLRVSPGFEPKGLLIFAVAPSSDKYPAAADVSRAYRQIQEQLATIPGVIHAASVSGLPHFGGEEDIRYTIPGGDRNETRRTALFHNVTPDYFATLRVPLRQGRDLSWRDTPAAPLAAVVNESFVRAAFAEGTAVGRQVTTDSGTFTVVGVVSDFLRRIEPRAAPQPEIYFPYSQRARWMTYVVLRTGAGAGENDVLAHVRERLGRIDPEFEPLGLRTMETAIGRAQRGPRFVALLFSVFAAVALLLSVIGVYGLVAYTLAQRTREIGIRVSLGARAADVLRVTVGSAALAVLAGAGVGVAGTLAARRALEAAVPSMGAIGGAQLVIVAALLALSAVAAALLPARRALRIDPVVTLKAE